MNRSMLKLVSALTLVALAAGCSSRNGVDEVVIYRWEIAPRWEEEHHLEIAIAQLDGGAAVSVRSELLSCWPYRNDELAAELGQVGLHTEMNTFNLEAENYTVVASKM